MGEGLRLRDSSLWIVDFKALGIMLFIMLAGYSPFDAPEVGSYVRARRCEVTQIYKNIIKGHQWALPVRTVRGRPFQDAVPGCLHA